jgi:small subunit ribosomal protein S8
MSLDPIADMFASLRNANAKYHERVDLPSSNVKQSIAKLLKDEGYISDFKILAERRAKIIRIFLKYMPDKTRVMRGLKRVSRPGLRVYRGSDELPKVNGLSDKQSRQQRMGGEIIGYVW